MYEYPSNHSLPPFKSVTIKCYGWFPFSPQQWSRFAGYFHLFIRPASKARFGKALMPGLPTYLASAGGWWDENGLVEGDSTSVSSACVELLLIQAAISSIPSTAGRRLSWNCRKLYQKEQESVNISTPEEPLLLLISKHSCQHLCNICVYIIDVSMSAKLLFSATISRPSLAAKAGPTSVMIMAIRRFANAL